MSKKLLATAIVLIALGGVAVPGGFAINNIVRDLTFSSVDEGLVGIKDQGIPLVIESFHQIGPASAFEIILEKGKDYSIPLVNSTIFMNQIYTVDQLASAAASLSSIDPIFWSWVIGPTIFGDINFSTSASKVSFPPIQGISEWINQDLNFTTYNYTIEGAFNNYYDLTGGVDRLKYGVNTTGWWGNRLPGIYEDTYYRVGDDDWPPDNASDAVNTVDVNQDRGFGVLQLMDLIESAENRSQIEALCGPNGYNLSNPYDNFTYNGENYTKLEILYFYYNDYFVHDVFDMILVQFNTPGTPLYNQYKQYQARDWNGYDVDYDDLAYYSYLEQWAKCNSFDQGADLHDAEPKIPLGTYGIEPGGPGKSSGIPMQATLKLWNSSSEYSFVNFPKGIQKWYDAYAGDVNAYNELLTEFSKYPGYDYENATYGKNDWGFNETDMDLILDWLWGNGGGWEHGSFSDYLLPLLIEANFDTTLEDFAFQILLEQWANGTIMDYPLYFDGFPLPLGFADIFGFEIGYQGKDQPIIPTNISKESALTLWDTSSDYSLVTKAGLQNWFAVVDGNYVAFQKVKNANGLTDDQVLLIVDWLPNFQQNVMPYLAQYQMGLPTDSITLGNMIQSVAVGVGAISLGFGTVGIFGSVVARKRKTKTYTPKKKGLDPFEVGSKTNK